MQLDYLKGKKYINITSYITNQEPTDKHNYIDLTTSIVINNQTYYIKRPQSEERILGELIAAKLLQKINVPHVEYYLGRYFDDVILISKSFKQKNCHYISGQQILIEYAEDQKTGKDPSDLNSLEEIWNAIENHYRKSKTPKQTLQITTRLMEELTTLLSFDLVIGNIDRHQSNWVIEEGKDNIHLSKIFDNEYLLDYYLDPESIESFAMASTYEELYSFASPYETIETYLSLSSSEFIKKLQQIKESLSTNTFIKAISEVEKDLGQPISPKMKLKLITGYRQHQKFISDSLNRYNRHL